MEKRYETILNSMEHVKAQAPSYFFKEKVLQAYAAGKEKVAQKVLDWFPWLKVEYQLSFLILLVMVNVFVFIQADQQLNRQNEIESLSKLFNAKP